MICDRVPEAANTHDKTYYVANKDHVYYSLEGISLHVQAHDLAELAHATSMIPNVYSRSSSL